MFLKAIIRELICKISSVELQIPESPAPKFVASELVRER
jgi:hypothetical protein